MNIPALLSAALVLWGAPLTQPSNPAIAYDATFTIPEGTLAGTASMAISADGRVTGTFEVPADGVTGTLGGDVAKGVWTVKMDYKMAGRDCDGLVTGRAEVAADKSRISGDVTIGGSCTRPEKAGSFVLRRRR